MRGMDQAVERIIDQLVQDLRELAGGGLVTVALYGSRARGDARPDSDIDLLVVCEGAAGERPRLDRDLAPAVARARERIEAAFGAASAPFLSVLVRLRETASYHSPLYLDMVEDARMLYDRDGFFAGVLAGLRANMARLGSRRVRLPDGGWYWDLKPDFRPGEEIVL